MDIKARLLGNLRFNRNALLWKTEGLTERDLRLPRTATGTNLLGLVKHCAGVEHEYFITSFGRTSDIVLPDNDYDADPNADLYASEHERAENLIALYRRVGEVVDQAINEMDLNTPGKVAWWGANGDVTLGQILVHVLGDIARHAGHADILREGIDGKAGLRTDNGNLWEPDGGWDAHVMRLTGIANAFD